MPFYFKIEHVFLYNRLSFIKSALNDIYWSSFLKSSITPEVKANQINWAIITITPDAYTISVGTPVVLIKSLVLE